MQKRKNIGHASIRAFLRVFVAAVLTPLLVVVAGEHRRTRVQAGEAPTQLRPHLYVLSIGINAYPNGSNVKALSGAVNDANEVALAFSADSGVGNAYNGQVEVKTLLDSAATVAGIRSAIQHFIDVCKPEDVVIFFFSGMGLQPKDLPDAQSNTKARVDYDFIAFDSSLAARGNWTYPATNPFTSRELSQLLLSIQAQRQIIILDSGQSADAFDSLSAALNSDSVFSLKSTGRRFALFGVEGEDFELTFPDDGLRHGLMAHSLLWAMRDPSKSRQVEYITEADLEGRMMIEMQQDGDVAGNEQLLSYSNLRGLCLSKSNRSAPSLTARCDTSYGYDPSVKPAEQTRGFSTTSPTPAQQVTSRGTDYALIIASNSYDHWPKLNNPIYDAQTLKQELIQNFGYDEKNILYRENPTKRDIFNLLTDLHGRTFGTNDRLLVYVAGHGFLEDKSGEGFIVTRETALPTEDPYLDSGLDLSRFRSTIDGLPVPHILLVLDVCYGGSFKDRKRLPEYTSAALDSPPSQDDLIADKMKSVSRLYIASGGLREAFDGLPGKHSPFARTFLKTLQQYGGPEHIIDMGKLDGAVYGLCPHPYYGTFGIQQEGGDFLFIPKPGAHPVSDPGLEARVDAPPCAP